MATRKQAERIQYLISRIMDWTDDSKVYGIVEDWRRPDGTNLNLYGLKLDDCDGAMTEASALSREYPSIPLYDGAPEDLLPIIKTWAKDSGIPDEDIGMFFVYCEPHNGGTVDGTSPRGGHAVLVLRNERKNGGYVLDNRSVTYNMSSPLWHDEHARNLPLGELIKLGMANPFVRTALEAEKFGYLFMSGNGLDGKGDWSIYDNEGWEWVKPIISRGQQQAKKEGN